LKGYFFFFDGYFRLKFVFFNGSFLVYGRVSSDVDGIIRLFEYFFPSFSFQCPGCFWGWCYGQNGKPDDFYAQDVELVVLFYLFP
jgi:hypothetical protein